MKSTKAPLAFIQALHKQHVSCGTASCPGPVSVEDASPMAAPVKTFVFRCESCDWEERIMGDRQEQPPWDEGSLMEITEEHLLHLEPVCPFDQAPLHFQSLPNPRRRARYRINCPYCGRQEELDWPPEEAKR